MTVTIRSRGYGNRARFGALILVLCTLTPLARASDDTTGLVKRYALIVANNLSLDDNVAPLRFADDDGARYFEMFTAAGAAATLLTTLDADAQKRHPEAAKVARPPNSRALEEALENIFTAIETDTKSGATVHFYFVYAGHGNVGPNQEGYLNLLDARLGRSMIYSQIVAKSKATFNHLILDACYAYFMVNKRGNHPDKAGDFRDEVRDFLSSETLARYPNTGVILATSSESETHEWQRFESGVFSHEVRSALMGAGDVDNDGRITYAEAAACVEAANAAIDVPKARLKVYAQPPAQQVDVPLMAMSAFRKSPSLTMPRELSGQYHIEDGRGIRTLDLHYSGEQPVTLKLVGEAPFYIRRSDEEAVIMTEAGVADLASLQFTPLAEGRRGSVEMSFRKHLFEIPFGVGFFRGMTVREEKSVSEPRASEMTGAMISPKPNPPSLSLKTDESTTKKGHALRRMLGFAAMGCGLAFGVSSGITYALARAEYKEYMAAKTHIDAKALRVSSGNLLSTSRVLLGVGAGMILLGAGLWATDRLIHRKSKRTSARNIPMPFGTIGEGHAYFGVARFF